MLQLMQKTIFRNALTVSQESVTFRKKLRFLVGALHKKYRKKCRAKMESIPSQMTFVTKLLPVQYQVFKLKWRLADAATF